MYPHPSRVVLQFRRGLYGTNLYAIAVVALQRQSDHAQQVVARATMWGDV